MGRTVEGRRRTQGWVERTLDIDAELDRRLVHHARHTRTPLEVIYRRALESECGRLDQIERERALEQRIG